LTGIHIQPLPSIEADACLHWAKKFYMPMMT